jgi:hypothetical protein
MSELTLAGLGVVLEVARTGSFSAAAERARCDGLRYGPEPFGAHY